MVRPADVGFGRIPAHGVGNDQDAAYPLRAALGVPVVLPNSKYWANFSRPPLDQGATSTCVAHAGKNWMLSAPVIQTTRNGEPKPYDLYRRIILSDEWGQNDSEASGPDSGLQFGTSVRALMSYFRDLGLLAEYRWAFSMDDLIEWLCLKGPLVLGINWYSGMMNPNAQGYIAPSGSVVGGHAVLLLGINRTRRDVTGLNSWGAWGPLRGRFRMTFADIERLVFAERGECAAGLEQRL